MLEMTMKPDLVTARIAANATLPTVATALLNSYVWMLGHGVWKFSVVREKLLHKSRAESSREGDCLLKVSALVPAQGLTFAGITDLGQLFDSGLVPKRASDTDYWGFNKPGQTTFGNVVGVHRFNGFRQGDGETIFAQPEIRRDITLDYLAYGWADMDVGYFMRGVQSAKHLLSQFMAQTWYDAGFAGDEMAKMLTKREDYNASAQAKELPGRFSPEHN